MTQARSPIEIWIDSVDTRLMVMEMMLGSFLVEAGRTHPDNVEHIRAVMSRTENAIIKAVSNSPEDKRHLAQATRDHFLEISKVLLGDMPHHGSH